VTALGNTLTASNEEYSASGVTVDVQGSGTVDVDLHSNLIYGVGMCSCCGCSAAGITIGVLGKANANIDIINNTLDDLQGTANGIQVRSPDTRSKLNLNLWNNVVSRAKGSAVQMPAHSDALAFANDYNAFHENGEDDWGDYSAGPHTINVDPKYMNPLNDDYHLKDTSALVGAGRNDPPGGLPTHDADGNARIAQGTVDIGAFESDYAAVTTTTVVTSTTSTSPTATSTTVVTTTTVAPTTTLAPTTTVPTTTVPTTTVPTTTSTSVVTTTVSTVPGASTTTTVTTPTSTTTPVTTTTTPSAVTTTTTVPSVVTTTTTAPPLVTTTTLPRPTCRDEATYPAIVCRMSALEAQVRAAQAGQLTSKLLGALGRAQAKTQAAERLTTGGQAARAKMSVRAAMRALSKMQVRLRSRAGKRIPDPLRTSMLDAAGRIGRDLRSLL
jgi:hypothetical protein